MRGLGVFLAVGFWLTVAPVWAAGTLTPAAGGGGSSLTVQEVDGSPSVANPTALKFTNGSVTDNGDGTATVATGSGTGAPTDATYLMQTANASTSAEQALGALSTGCLGVTTTTGVVNSRTLTGTANQISVANGTCGGNPTFSIPTDPTLPGTVSATAFTATGASSGILDINGVTSGKLRLTTADATAQTITVTGAAQTSGATTLTIPDMAGANDTFMFAAKAVTKTNLTLDAEGTGNVITLPKRLWFPAAGCNNATAGSVWDLPTSNAPEALCKTGTNTQKGVLAFDATTDESAQVHYLLPSTWTGTVDARIVWYSATTTSPVAWCVQLVSTAAGETDDPAFPAQATGNCVSSAAAGTTLQMNIATITGATITGVAASELLHIQISRDPNETSTRTDTSATDAFLVGVELTIREAI